MGKSSRVMNVKKYVKEKFIKAHITKIHTKKKETEKRKDVEGNLVKALNHCRLENMKKLIEP